jgi:hypothetical protein
MIKKELKSIKIVHVGLMTGVFVFIVFSVYLNQLAGSFAFEEDSVETKLFMVISNVMAVFSISSGIFIFKKRIKDIGTLDLFEKLTKYREAMIIRTATIEGATFFFIVCFMLSGSNIFLLESIVGFLLITFLFPTNFRIAKEIEHDIRELDKF